MTGQSFTIAFVIWRETVEALLVVGILNAWLGQREAAERRVGRRWLWGGVGAGLIGAIAFAFLLIAAGDVLGDEGQEYFQTAIVLVAAALIVQMVVWMRRHGRTLRSELHGSLDKQAASANWIGVFVLAFLAVMREGSEAAVFLYGTMASAAAAPLVSLLAVALGLLGAVATYGLLQFGGRVLSWRAFFRMTEAMLLFLAAALLLTGVDHLISLGFVPPIIPRLWDTSRLLSDSGALGGLVAGFTGYRAKPALVEILVYAGYWAAVLWLLYLPRREVRA